MGAGGHSCYGVAAAPVGRPAANAVQGGPGGSGWSDRLVRLAARILEIGPWGIRDAAWQDLELVTHWRRYLEEPMRYLRHVIETD